MKFGMFYPVAVARDIELGKSFWGLDRKRYGSTIDDHRAGAAVAVAATFLGAGEPDAVAQQVEQRVACVGEYRALLAVDRAGHECLHACSCSAAQHSARARAVNTATSERR